MNQEIPKFQIELKSFWADEFNESEWRADWEDYSPKYLSHQITDKNLYFCPDMQPPLSGSTERHKIFLICPDRRELKDIFMKFAKEYDDLIYFAQKVSKAKSTQARLQALRQLRMIVQAAEVKTQAELRQERENR